MLPPDLNSKLGDLKSKAEKIRTLAHNGYKTAEIASCLGISYQHARNVLVRSGLYENSKKTASSKPLLNAKRPPELILAPSEHPQSVLLEAGFSFIGSWNLNEDKLSTCGDMPISPGVYSFCVDGFIAYVGLAQRGVKARMTNYRIGNPRQRTSARIRKLICQALREGHVISILSIHPGRSLEWNGLPVDVSAGLECGLIKALRPAWNLSGLGKSHAKAVSG